MAKRLNAKRIPSATAYTYIEKFGDTDSPVPADRPLWTGGRIRVILKN